MTSCLMTRKGKTMISMGMKKDLLDLTLAVLVTMVVIPTSQVVDLGKVDSHPGLGNGKIWVDKEEDQDHFHFLLVAPAAARVHLVLV